MDPQFLRILYLLYGQAGHRYFFFGNPGEDTSWQVGPVYDAGKGRGLCVAKLFLFSTANGEDFIVNPEAQGVICLSF